MGLLVLARATEGSGGVAMKAVVSVQTETLGGSRERKTEAGSADVARVPTRTTKLFRHLTS